MAIRPNLNVDDRKVSARRTDAVPNTANCMNERVRLAVIDFATDTSNIDIDDVGCGVEMKIPHVLQQHRPGHHSARIANEILKQLEFARKQVDITGSTAGRPRYEIQLEIADTQHRFLDDGITPPRKRLNACEQFHERERLCKVVVTTRTQPAYAIVNFTESADNQNRR